jgi:alpha-amylase/alpha-mannosidase (GH57 family)
MTRVALLWHMHQPSYEDLVTREHILPWVRLHGLKDYYGMAALLEEFPGVKVTFNLVPSLLVQLEAFAREEAHDRYLELGLKPADGLAGDEIRFILLNFFHAQRRWMIEPHRRYAELLALRGSMRTAGDVAEAIRRFSTDDLRDLQVWQKLAWVDPYYLERDPRVQTLLEKGRNFTEDDKALLHGVELEILNRILPTYRTVAASGQIEIATSPFYHPILPLLCDSDVYLRTHPQSPMPRRRFVHPEDALEQLERAAACHERLFGRRPIGLWPSEGSVSDAMVPLAARAGFKWMASDELVLARTLNTTFARESSGHVDQPRRLYAAYRVTAGGADIACAFRDHGLSDLIGFHYSNWPADAASADFVARLVEAGRRTGQTSGEEATIFVILDGENAWEHFEGGGRPFLRSLYGRLAGHPELQTVTMAEACRAPRETLPGIFPGSWIDANFYIWIGHADDRRAWDQLATAREVWESATEVDAGTRTRAREEILISEGSDWFWWYGDDHSSDHDAEFDDLFRRHLRNVYRLLDRPIPDELFLSNITAGVGQPQQLDPTGLIAPVVDGQSTSYFEWLGAGEVEARDTAGAMHQAERRPGVLTRAWFGFDEAQWLYVRVDAHTDVWTLLNEGYMLTVTFLEPRGLRVTIRRRGDRIAAALTTRPSDHDPWTEATFEGRAAAGTVLECAIPPKHLGAAGTHRLAFVVTLCDAAGIELERHPSTRPIETAIPDAEFEARHWTA